MSAIPDPIRKAARNRPEAPAIIAGSEVLAYADLDRKVTATAAHLAGLGLERGDRLAVYRPSDVDYLVLLLAAFRLGLVVCPLSTRQPTAVVPDLLSRIACESLVAEPDPAWDELRVIDYGASELDLFSCDEETEWHLDAPATIIFTSGSTGTPKAALHTLGNHVWSARGLVEHIPLEPGERWLLDLPLYHVGGLAILFRCILTGAAVVLPHRGEPVERTLAERGVTHASFVATQLLRLLQRETEALGRMKAILLGGSAMPPSLIADAHARSLPIHTSYGLSEMASTVTATPHGASLEALGTSGISLPHREVRLSDDGEILVRGTTLFLGYLEGGEVVRPTAGDGWFPTGDLGAWVSVDGEAMLRVVGRKDSLFISGGENVQPEAIEAALGRVAGIRQALVVPVADEEFGQRPVAFIDAEAWQPDRWSEALARELPRFMLPAAMYPWPQVWGGAKPNRQYFAEHAERLRSEER